MLYTLQMNMDVPLLEKLTGKVRTVVENFSVDTHDVPENPKIVQELTEAHSSKECDVRYEIGDWNGFELKPGEAVVILLPEEKQGRNLDSITLRHRKDSKYRDTIDETDWDNEGAYTRVLVYDTKTKAWIPWPDPYKSGGGISRGDKFAEVRPASNPEAEVLYDWLAKVGEVQPDKIALISVGKGKKGISTLHSLDVSYFPETGETQHQQEVIFSPGTAFVDPDKGVLEAKYGGGMKLGGKYPHAMPLNHRNISEITFPITIRQGDNVYLDEQGRLHWVLQKEADISRIEVSVGDTEDTGEQNKDGHTGRLGWAKLDAFIAKPDGRGGYVNGEQVMDTINVPPNGVLKGSPKEKIHVVPGDEIIVRAKNDAAYVMGIRIQ